MDNGEACTEDVYAPKKLTFGLKSSLTSMPSETLYRSMTSSSGFPSVIRIPRQLQNAPHPRLAEGVGHSEADAVSNLHRSVWFM